jgi:hypothetical protein
MAEYTSSFFEELSKLDPTQLRRMQEASLNWYRRQMVELGQIKPSDTNFQAIANDKTTKPTPPASIILPGRMFYYRYYPKYNKDLPYYDEYPLILFVQRVPDGFYGINLHYVAPVVRARILDILRPYMIQRGTPNGRVSVRLKDIIDLRQFYVLKPLVKKYLHAHVRSRMLQIDPKYWSTAVYLPIQRFRRASDQRVWADSWKKIQSSRRNPTQLPASPR